MNTYEIAISLYRDIDGGIVDFHSSTIVRCDIEVPAGTIPASVIRHAEMLRTIVAHHAEVEVSWHELANLTATGCHSSAHSIKLAAWNSNAGYKTIMNGDGWAAGLVSLTGSPS
jgi:hypothetical protein